MAKLIKTDGRTITVAPLDGQQFSLPELQRIVGGNIEAVTLKIPPNPIVLWVNEDGHRLNLPLNPKATAIYQQCGGVYPILGDALLTMGSEVD